MFFSDVTLATCYSDPFYRQNKQLFHAEWYFNIMALLQMTYVLYIDYRVK